MKRPILYIVIPFCVGIALGRFLKIPIIYPVILSALFVVFALLKSGKNVLSHTVLYIALLFFGMACYQNSSILPRDHIANYSSDAPKKIFVKGTIVSDPLTTLTFYKEKKTAFTLKAEAVKNASGWKSASGLAKASVYSEKGIGLRFGDELILEALILNPSGPKDPGVFDYTKYLQTQNIYSLLTVKEDFFMKKTGNRAGRFMKAAYGSRCAIRNLFDTYLKPPYGGFMNAILIGDRSELDDVLKDDFVKTGTVHILAISGLNVGLIAALFLAFFGILRLPKKFNFMLTLIFLIFYTVVAGSSPPIVRATMMFAVFVIGYMINRETDTLNSLSLAAFLMLLWNPKELFDPSFQLSFASLAAVIIFVPKINELAGPDMLTGRTISKKIFRYLYLGVATSIAAWLGTWPIISSYFNMVSPISVIANLVDIPLLFVLTAASFIFAAVGFVSGFLANATAPFLCAVERFLFMSNHFFAGIPFSYFRVGAPGAAFFVIYYVLLFLLFFPKAFEFGRIKITRSRVLLVILLVLNISVWKENINFNNKTLKITFLDVGQGDSIFMELPGRGSVLIDGGPGGEEGKYDAGESIVAPYLWNKGIRSIDAVIVTHFHADHLGGLIYILKNFKVGCVIDNGARITDSAMYYEYMKVLKDKCIRHFTVADGDTIESQGGVKFFVLNPEEKPKLSEALSSENDNSLVLKLIYKNFSCMLCGDATSAPMQRLLSYDSFLKSDVMKISHHGGRLGDEKIASEFFMQVAPKVCVTSAGQTGRNFAKAGEMPDFITYLNSTSYVTNKDGAITVSIDEKLLYSVKTYISKN